MLHLHRIICVGMLAILASCSTLNSASVATRSSPKYFTGTRLNVAAISRDEQKLLEFERYNMKPAKYPAADLPLSAALDAALLPAIVGCEIELFGPDFGCYSPSR